MRIILTLIVLLLSGSYISAQNTFSVGYLGHGIVRPGVKLGLEVPIKTLERKKIHGGIEVMKSRQFFVRPSVGAFTRPRFYTSTIVDLASGWSWSKPSSKFGSAFSFGLGFLAQNEVIRLRTNFKGDITEKDKELRGYFLPNINYSVHRSIGENTGIYTQWSYGMKLSPSRQRAANFFMEIGLLYSIKSTKSAND